MKDDSFAGGRIYGEAGFTIVELLVVIGVLGVLVALLASAVITLQGSGRASKCLNNERQLGVAMAMYAQDNGNRYPPLWDGATNKVSWRSQLNLYLGIRSTDGIEKAKVWFCPGAVVLAESAPVPCHYGINPMVNKSPWSRKTMAPPEPSRYVIIGEQNRNTEGFDFAEKGCFDGKSRSGNRFSHPGHTANYLFGDGHVESLSYPGASGLPATLFSW